MPGAGPTSPHEPLHAALRREGWRCVAIDRSAAQLGALHEAHAVHEAPPAAAAAATATASASAYAATAAAAAPPLLRLLPCVSDARAVRRAARHAAGVRPFVWLALRGAEEARATTAAHMQHTTLHACSTHAARMQHTMQHTCGTHAAHMRHACSRHTVAPSSLQRACKAVALEQPPCHGAPLTLTLTLTW